MAKIPRNKANKGRKQYSMKVKTYARKLKTIDNLKNWEIRKKLHNKFNVTVPASTLATWYNKVNQSKVANLPEDRLNVNDKRLNPKQRPDILVDTEVILVKKVFAVKLRGLGYTRELIQMYAMNIFHKLISYNIYNAKGMRREQSQPLDEVIVRTVTQCKLHSRYLAKSCANTEFHKSIAAARNDKESKSKFSCTMCPRKFKSQVNLTLHIYFHAVKEAEDNIDDDPDDVNAPPDITEVHKFVASPGWVEKFKVRHGIGKYKMKGEKGSADYDAVDPWVHEFLTFLFTQYVTKDHKSLNQILTIILNFDETGFQYKSIPQYSYLVKKQEIRAKKPVLCRITGLFGASASGHKFKPLIIGKSKRPRAFNALKSLDELPVHYYNNNSAWMTKEIFRDWFETCFIPEVQPIIDPDMQIQFLMDNCTSHNDEMLYYIEPKVFIRFLPANTTALMQPMDQAVLHCVKSYQKNSFTLNCSTIVRRLLTQLHLKIF